jgi:hypothetical protein
MEKESLVAIERIESKVFLIRGQKVMLDIDLAALYEVEVRALNQAVKRNFDRFPGDFMFQLTVEEAAFLRSQFVTLKSKGGSVSSISSIFSTIQPPLPLLLSETRDSRIVKAKPNWLLTFAFPANCQTIIR